MSIIYLKLNNFAFFIHRFFHLKVWKAELALVLITLIWGATFTFTKNGLENCSPSLFLILRFSISIIIALIFFNKYLRKISKNILKNGIVLGVLLGGGFVFQTYGLKDLMASKSAIITGLSVTLTPFAFWIVRRRKIEFWQIIGVVIATIGLWLFNPYINTIATGDILVIISTVFWAFYITYMDVFTKPLKTFKETAQLVIIQIICVVPVALITFLIFDLHNLYFIFNSQLVLSLAYNGIIASFILTLIHTSVQRYTTPVKAALIFSLEPVFASIIAFIFLQEQLKVWEYIGGSLMLFGVIVSEVGPLLFILWIKYLKFIKKID